MSFTIGSLFDGSGGFPLAAAMCGGVPKWASEIEPYPIAVTRSRFPNMKHLGDVSKINGAEIEPVDVITFGSPCQDLSVAGKRAGLKHEEKGDDESTRSGLFIPAVRVIKEMRRATNGVYPRIVIFENVPGALSSRNGEDFRTVLEELIKIIEPSAVMPAVPKGGWPYADSYCGDGFSISYRVFDAQHFGKTIRDGDGGNILVRGTPQRRRRLFLVADFGGQCARAILFKSDRVCWNNPQSGSPWQEAARVAEAGAGATDCAGIVNLNKGDVQSKTILDPRGISPALYAGECRGGGGEMYVMVDDSPAYTTQDRDGKPAGVATNRAGVCVTYGIDQQGGKGGANYTENVSPTLCSDSHGTPHAVAYTLKIRSGCDKDVYGKPAGKGALIQTDLSATLAASQDQYLFQPVVDAVGVDVYNQSPTGDKAKTLSSAATDADHVPCVCGCLASSAVNAEMTDGSISPCIMARAGTGGNQRQLVAVAEQTTVAIEGNGSRPSHRGDGFAETDVMYTLNSTEHHAVAYTMQSFGDYKDCGVASGLKARDYKDATDLVAEPCPVAIDRAAFNQGSNAQYNPQYLTDGTNPTLTARGPSGVAYSMKSISRSGNPLTEQANPICASDYKDPDIVAYPTDGVRYIVRRLTPTECARLQGFPDFWGHPDVKDALTDEEYAFWLNVRKTHAAINGKAVKDYTKEQMLKWYNGLHTDSAEYKMWGNGVSLPCVLFIMRGIADVFARERGE